MWFLPRYFTHWVDESLLIYFYNLFQGNFSHWAEISSLMFFLFQGNFTHWVDGSPLLDPDWYKHEETYFKTYAIYDLTTNEVTRHDVLNVSSLKKQPEYNIDKNCTALPVGHHLTRYS